MSKVVLITGVSRYLGGRLAARLVADPSIDRVIGLDTVTPRRSEVALLGRTEFVRADIRNPLIATMFAQARVDTVVHTAVAAPQHGLRRGPMPGKDLNVIGTMQLLAACQKSETVGRVVLRSTTAVYGAGAADPAVFTEDMPAANTAPGFAADAVEVEGYVRGFRRRRPDVTVSVLRFAELIGPSIDSVLTRYLARPIVATSLGFDPRIQLLHESDAVEVLRLACVGDRPGTVNVAGEGVLLLSQLLRRAGRLPLPLPSRAMSVLGGLLGNAGWAEVCADRAGLLDYGRAVDTGRLRTEFGYTPRYTTGAALASFLQARPARTRCGLAALDRSARRPGSSPAAPATAEVG